MFGLQGASRFPRVSFRTERPFIIGTGITFGLITWLHYSIWQNVKPTDADPFTHPPKKADDSDQ